MAANLTVFNRFPIIELDDEYILRQPKLSDAPRYMAYINKPGVAKYVPDSCLPTSIQHAQRDLQYIINLFLDKKSFYWVIARRDTDELVGTCGYESWHQFHGRLELAYDLDPDYWRQGITTKAVIQLMHFGFKKLNVARVEAFTALDNKPSVNLLKKLGFQFETTLRKYRYFKKKHVDINLHSLVKSDYMQHLASSYNKAQFK